MQIAATIESANAGPAPQRRQIASAQAAPDRAPRRIESAPTAHRSRRPRDGTPHFQRRSGGSGEFNPPSPCPARCNI